MYKCLEVQVPTKPLKLVEKPIPVPPSRGMVIKTGAAAICNSDIPIADNYLNMSDTSEDKSITQYDPDFKYPVVLGHEVAGTVYSIGEGRCPGSDEFNVGDRVAVYTLQGCQECRTCTSGNHLLCPKRTSQTLGKGKNGGYAEYVSVPNRKFVFKLPDSIAMDAACMFSCSALTAYNAVTRTKPAIANALKMLGSATLLIIGAGGLGQWAIQIARAVLPRETKILVADITEERLAVVKESVDMTIRWSADEDDMTFMERVAEVTGNGPLVEASIDFVGAPATTKRAVWLANKGSTHCIVGLFGGDTTFPVPFVPCKMIDIHGIYLGSTQQMQEVIQLAAEGKIRPPPLEHVTLDGVNDALDKLRKGQIKGRAIITFD
ncbi:unnamed protein product [Owenia fusiformis]|uniref:Uncharacterized protein n=1 Tax=Owenia fusiformis TaxID=6347 RepID=A0A8J1UW07_OWEFU|nr:unnamed protein product [Owenia fusiformis]